jgi:nitrogen fixation NifU-like protein
MPTPYHAIVLEHQRNPRNFGALAGFTHAANGDNALCGDHVRVEVEYRDGRVVAMRFSGESCAIATASASMLSEIATGRDAAAIAELAMRLRALVGGEIERDATLGALNALAELRNYPSRRKCALLPWAALSAALAGTANATTESPIER